MMDEDQIIDEVGKFYATIYDGVTDFLAQIQDQLVGIPCDTGEQKTSVRANSDTFYVVSFSYCASA